MQEDNSGNGPNGLGRENLESPRGKSKGNISSSNNSNKEQDRFLPIANVGRIMKKVITGNGKISKDAKETVQECVSEFISFVTGEASDKCQREKRKTINGDDIIWAITTLGFEDYVAPLKLYLRKYREIEEEKLNIPKQQRQQRSDHQQRSQVVLQHHQPDHHQEQIMPPYTASHHVYSSTGFMSHQQPSFVSADQAFALSFTPSSIQKQFPQQDQIDSVSHW